jgi:hypothetical protein
MTRRGRAFLAFLAGLALVTSFPKEARADDEAALPYFTLGLPFLLGGMFSDTVQWAIIGTTNASTHWALHAIPIAGPIIGFTAFNSSHCGTEPQCSTPEPVIKTTEAAYLLFELSGLVLTGVGLYKRTQPRYAAPADAWSRVRIVPTASIAPNNAALGVAATF